MNSEIWRIFSLKKHKNSEYTWQYDLTYFQLWLIFTWTLVIWEKWTPKSVHFSHITKLPFLNFLDILVFCVCIYEQKLWQNYFKYFLEKIKNLLGDMRKVNTKKCSLFLISPSSLVICDISPSHENSVFFCFFKYFHRHVEGAKWQKNAWKFAVG